MSNFCYDIEKALNDSSSTVIRQVLCLDRSSFATFLRSPHTVESHYRVANVLSGWLDDRPTSIKTFSDISHALGKNLNYLKSLMRALEASFRAAAIFLHHGESSLSSHELKTYLWLSADMFDRILPQSSQPRFCTNDSVATLLSQRRLSRFDHRCLPARCLKPKTSFRHRKCPTRAQAKRSKTSLFDSRHRSAGKTKTARGMQQHRSRAMQLEPSLRRESSTGSTHSPGTTRIHTPAATVGMICAWMMHRQLTNNAPVLSAGSTTSVLATDRTDGHVLELSVYRSDEFEQALVPDFACFGLTDITEIMRSLERVRQHSDYAKAGILLRIRNQTDLRRRPSFPSKLSGRSLEAAFLGALTAAMRDFPLNPRMIISATVDAGRLGPVLGTREKLDAARNARIQGVVLGPGSDPCSNYFSFIAYSMDEAIEKLTDENQYQGLNKFSMEYPSVNRIGNYQITGFICEGRHCWVLKAVDVSTKRPCALKLPRLEISPDRLRLFKHELRCTPQIPASRTCMESETPEEKLIDAELNGTSNPLEVSTHGNLPVIVLPYIAGQGQRPAESLESLLASGKRLHSGIALLIAMDVAKAAGELHAKGFVHNGICPSNILVSEELSSIGRKELKQQAQVFPELYQRYIATNSTCWIAKLIDYSLCTPIANAGQNVEDGNAVHHRLVFAAIQSEPGLSGFLAPEIIKSLAVDSAASTSEACDVYSIGCLLNAMISGGPPLPGSIPEIRNLLDNVWDLPILENQSKEDRHPVVEMILRSALITDRKLRLSRYPTVNRLVEDLLTAATAIAEGARTSNAAGVMAARDLNTVERGVRFTVRRPAVVLTLSLLLSTFCFATGFLYYSRASTVKQLRTEGLMKDAIARQEVSDAKNKVLELEAQQVDTQRQVNEDQKRAVTLTQLQDTWVTFAQVSDYIVTSGDIHLSKSTLARTINDRPIVFRYTYFMQYVSLLVTEGDVETALAITDLLHKSIPRLTAVDPLTAAAIRLRVLFLQLAVKARAITSGNDRVAQRAGAAYNEMLRQSLEDKVFSVYISEEENRGFVESLYSLAKSLSATREEFRRVISDDPIFKGFSETQIESQDATRLLEEIRVAIHSTSNGSILRGAQFSLRLRVMRMAAQLKNKVLFTPAHQGGNDEKENDGVMCECTSACRQMVLAAVADGWVEFSVLKDEALLKEFVFSDAEVQRIICSVEERQARRQEWVKEIESVWKN